VKPASLSGRVVDKKDQRGIAGAVVSISRAELISQILQTNEASLVITTDAQGAFTLSPVLPGTYFLAASANGYVPGVRARLIVDSGDAQTGIELALEAGGSTVSGTVSDLLGGPIANARVTAKQEDTFDLSGTADLVAITKDDGTYSLTLAEGTYELRATHDEYTSSRANIELTPAPVKRDFVLTPGGVVRGQVIARDSGQPVGGAWLLSGRVGDPGGEQTARSDDQGNFVLRGLRPGALQIRAQGPGYASTTPAIVELGIGEQLDGVKVLVDRAFSISGTVVRRGKPNEGVPGVQLGVFSLATQQFGLALEPTDDEGAFVIHGVRPASYMLFAGGEGNVPELGTSVEVVDKDVTDVKVEMSTGVTLSGRVEPPQANVRMTVVLTGGGSLLQIFDGVKAALVHGETDETGAFKVPNAPSGAFTLTATAKSGDTGTLSVLIGDKDMTDLVVKLETRPSIAGRVVNDKGAPVADATVLARSTEERGSFSFANTDHSATTRADGSFKIVGLDAGTFKLSVRDNDRQQPLRFKDKPAPVQLAKAQALTGIVLTVEARDGVIRGVVIGADRKPVADAWVTAQRDRPDFKKITESDGDKKDEEAAKAREEAMEWEGASKPVLTGADGRFTIDKLRRNGTYKVVAEGPRGNSRAEAPAVKTGTSVTLQLLSLGTLTGKVTDASGKPVPAYDIACDGPDDDFEAPRAIDSKEGIYRLERLAPGAYECAVTADAGEANGKVDVIPGDASLDFKLAPWGVVTGKVVDVMTKKPVKGINVMVNSSMGAKLFEDMLRGKSPKTDDSGVFTLDRVKPGEGMVSFMQSDLFFGEPLSTKPYNVASGQRLDLGTIEIVAPREGDAGTFGFAATINDSGKLAVTSVKEGGPAAAAGMKEGDLVTQINGMTLGEQLSPLIAQKLVSSGVVGVGIPIQLTLDRGGSPITMSLVSVRW
jgi:protocatechuate 3,4-dioxygenase beta subunit